MSAALFTSLISPPPAATAPAHERFLHLVRLALAGGQFGKLLLSGPVGDEADVERLTVRAIELRGEPALSFLWRHRTKDVTKNHAPEAGLAEIGALLGGRFRNAHLHTAAEEVQFAVSRKGRETLRVTRVDGAQTPDPAAHDKAKHRPLDMAHPVWSALGLTHLVKGEPALVPAMARKWKQINRFVEILASAVAEAGLTGPVRVADFGSGKGYLTFAVHDWLRSQGLDPRVTGIELRDDMVRLCTAIIDNEGLAGIRFDQGDVRTQAVQPLDVMIALHACDIATDHALHVGLQSGASIIMSSPCCHKELRPQMALPAVLRPMLQHGIHLGQEAEMVTDSLRALLLESQGYRTQVFEFIALEHTSKNKMILAVKARGAAAEALAARRPELLAQVAEIKRFYGLREQRLEQLLGSP
ncbi:class I SAM-dependent methyltransferase [Roseateles saccharophilus]|uniref:Methyltransferase family protein n=1 Tax=Roseateles saccharophilus TaxID=304 RepID=A0A4R3UG80_ROSSA|nr:SAM-dependent methyltransferase [Roseateles saccharophilus]MDG0835207.1 SAM-dependent methyltransferase [Roseateles saccharophilus]TCU87139.1 methyltransferase family protein [Roseateles saccharophilus]